MAGLQFSHDLPGWTQLVLRLRVDAGTGISVSDL
jgi:hypothetical protein